LLLIFQNLLFNTMKKTLIHGLTLLMLGLLVASCGRKTERSSTTNWKYNDQKWGGFEKLDYEGQATGPNLVLIEGGTFTQGLTDQDVTFEWNNSPRRVTVSSFYMDETEVANIDYREYLFLGAQHLGNHLPGSLETRTARYPRVARRTGLQRAVGRNVLPPPAYDDYPVVGISWLQANEYCKWRTDRVNEMILIERGILENTPDQKNENNFNTEAYLVGQYEGSVRKNLPDRRTGGERHVQLEDGILLPIYRLPTEAEWEYAALSLLGNQATSKDELITDRRIYPWDGNTVRYQKRNKYQGKMLANFKRSGGDYGGMAGALNDKAFTPAPVRSNWPNDYGLYNMAGNVNEWTADLFRP
jgi:sulfatase modifying factor 1